MNETDEIKAIRLEIEELNQHLRMLAERQNAQYTDLMLKLDELKAEKEQLDFVVMDAARQMEVLFEDAKMAVMRAHRASTSYLQRKLNIGYGKAVMLIDRLEKEGVIGPADGAKPRAVLVERAEPAELDEDTEELYEKAEKAVLENGEASIEFLQREFDIGYSRAACLLDALADRKVIEKGNGATRKVLEQQA